MMVTMKRQTTGMHENAREMHEGRLVRLLKRNGLVRAPRGCTVAGLSCRASAFLLTPRPRSACQRRTIGSRCLAPIPPLAGSPACPCLEHTCMPPCEGPPCASRQILGAAVLSGPVRRPHDGCSWCSWQGRWGPPSPRWAPVRILDASSPWADDSMDAQRTMVID